MKTQSMSNRCQTQTEEMVKLFTNESSNPFVSAKYGASSVLS